MLADLCGTTWISRSVAMRCRNMSVCILTLLISSCAIKPPQINAMTTLPAKYGEVTRLRRVAVVPFDGEHGREIAAQVESQLVSARVNDAPYFTVVERARIDQMLGELKLSSSAIVDQRTAVKIGKILAVQAIYMGSVVRPKVSDSQYTESRSECSYYVTKYNKKGKPYEECGGTRTYNVRCTKRVVDTAIIPKVVEVETGRIIYSTTISDSQQENACEDKGSLKSVSEMVNDARRHAISTFRTHVAPHQEAVSILLMKETDGMDGATASKFSIALEYAQAGRIDRACELWNAALLTSTNAAALVYSRGLCDELAGNYPKALVGYRGADRILNKPHEAISSALNRVQKRIDDDAKLAKQARP